jgi:hypothetical protein
MKGNQMKLKVATILILHKMYQIRVDGRLFISEWYKIITNLVVWVLTWEINKLKFQIIR